MFNTSPNEWTLGSITEYVTSDSTPMALLKDPAGVIPPRYIPARPYGFGGLRSHLKLAWMVFTDKADVLIWPGQMPKAY